jgi:hypothetical protein
VRFVNVLVTALQFSGSLSNSTSIISVGGTSNVHIESSVFNGVSSYAGSSAIFSDVGSTGSRTIVVKINGSVFIGILYIYVY